MQLFSSSICWPAQSHQLYDINLAHLMLQVYTMTSINDHSKCLWNIYLLYICTSLLSTVFQVWMKTRLHIQVRAVLHDNWIWLFYIIHSFLFLLSLLLSLPPFLNLDSVSLFFLFLLCPSSSCSAGEARGKSRLWWKFSKAVAWSVLQLISVWLIFIFIIHVFNKIPRYKRSSLWSAIMMFLRNQKVRLHQ